MQNFAQLVNQLLAPGLGVYVENSNEVWNSGFGQYNYVEAQGAAQGLDGAQYHGLRTRAIGAIFILIAYLLAFAGGLALQFAFPTIVLAVDRGGVGGGLNFAQVLATIRGNTSTALMAGLFSFLLYLIAGFGQIACFVGFYFTLAWAMAGLAAVVYWEERNLAPVGGMPAPQASSAGCGWSIGLSGPRCPRSGGSFAGCATPSRPRAR